MGENGISISDTKQVKVNVFDDEDLLSDEERAALELDDDDPDGKAGAADIDNVDDEIDAADAAAAKKAQEEAEDAKKQEQIDKADAAIAAKEDAAKKAAADKAAAGTAADEAGKKAGEEASGSPDDTDQEVFVSSTPPPVSMKALSDAEVNDIKQQLADKKKAFQEGEIDYDTYFDDRLALERKLWQNDIALQLSVDGVENQWKWEQESFLNARENAWINDDDVVYAAFAATVNRIMATDEGSVMPGPQLLAKAREEVGKRFAPAAANDAAAQAAEEARKKAAAIKGAKASQAGKGLPDTLGGVPAAEAELGTGEFDWIDKLEGEAYEKAVEGLSEEQLKRYEASI